MADAIALSGGISWPLDAVRMRILDAKETPRIKKVDLGNVNNQHPSLRGALATKQSREPRAVAPGLLRCARNDDGGDASNYWASPNGREVHERETLKLLEPYRSRIAIGCRERRLKTHSCGLARVLSADVGHAGVIPQLRSDQSSSNPLCGTKWFDSYFCKRHCWKRSR